MSDKNYAGERILTPVGTASYPSLFKKNKFDRFSLTLLIPKDKTQRLPRDTEAMKALRAEATKVALEYFGVATTKDLPAKFKSPFKDGDELNEALAAEGAAVRPENAGMWVINAWTNDMGGQAIIGPDKKEIMNHSEFYAGCKARAYFTPFGYDHGANRGVSFFLGAVQKTGEGQPLSKGHSNPEVDFTAIEPEAGTADKLYDEDDSLLGI